MGVHSDGRMVRCVCVCMRMLMDGGEIDARFGGEIAASASRTSTRVKSGRRLLEHPSSTTLPLSRLQKTIIQSHSTPHTRASKRQR